MTLIVVLLYGFGTVLIVSSLQVGKDGKSISVLQTIRDIWSGNSSSATTVFTLASTPPAAGPTGPTQPLTQQQANIAAHLQQL